jgi:hypothetical protein
VAHSYGVEENGIQVFCGGNIKGKTLERPGHRWEDIVKMGFKETGWTE